MQGAVPIHTLFLNNPTLKRDVQRVDAARSRIESLNPLVAVETISDTTSLDWDVLVKRSDIVCLTDGTRHDLVRPKLLRIFLAFFTQSLVALQRTLPKT